MMMEKLLEQWMFYFQELVKWLVDLKGEERLDVLKAKMADLNIDEEELWWYFRYS